MTTTLKNDLFNEYFLAHTQRRRRDDEQDDDEAASPELKAKSFSFHHPSQSILDPPTC